MEVYALADDFSLVTPNIPYSNLQWSRKYYEAGDWEMQIPASAYDSSWAYLVTNDRPEVGLVQKVDYSADGSSESVSVSGFFAEKLLDGLVTGTRFKTDKSRTETAVKAFCEHVGLYEKKGIYFIENETLLGDRTQCDFIGESLGDKAFSILETRGLSYRVRRYKPTATRGALSVQVWQGVDRTINQSSNPVALFSQAFGNVAKVSASVDESAFANVCLVSANDEALQFEVDNSNGGERFETFLDKNSEKPEDGESAADFRAGLEQEALERLEDLAVSVDIDVDNFGAAGYMTDFDLGDMVTVELANVGLSLDARVSEVSEVFKASGHTVTLGFGNKRITNIERAVMRA